MTRSGNSSKYIVLRFFIANFRLLCHKPGFVARLIKGCRVDVRAGCFVFEKNLSTSNALTSILAAKAPLGRVFLWQ